MDFPTLLIYGRKPNQIVEPVVIGRHGCRLDGVLVSELRSIFPGNAVVVSQRKSKSSDSYGSGWDSLASWSLTSKTNQSYFLPIFLSSCYVALVGHLGCLVPNYPRNLLREICSRSKLPKHVLLSGLYLILSKAVSRINSQINLGLPNCSGGESPRRYKRCQWPSRRQAI